jgi:hypothetical protein
MRRVSIIRAAAALAALATVVFGGSVRTPIWPP